MKCIISAFPGLEETLLIAHQPRMISGERYLERSTQIQSGVWTNLADIYYAQGRYDKAEALQQEALNLRREVLVPKHPDTAQSIKYLASTQESLHHARSLVGPDEVVDGHTDPWFRKAKHRHRSWCNYPRVCIDHRAVGRNI